VESWPDAQELPQTDSTHFGRSHRPLRQPLWRTIISAARSAMAIVGALVLPLVVLGMSEVSARRALRRHEHEAMRRRGPPVRRPWRRFRQGANSFRRLARRIRPISAFPRGSLSTSRLHHWDSSTANPMSRKCLTAAHSAAHGVIVPRYRPPPGQTTNKGWKQFCPMSYRPTRRR
jgi:hypothetical protein